MQIRKANVDHFGHGQAVPKCEFLLRWPHRDKPHVCLIHDVDITGAQGCSYFTLYIPDEGKKFTITVRICESQCIQNLSFPAEDTPTLSPVPPDSELFSPSSWSTTAFSPRGVSAAHSHN